LRATGGSAAGGLPLTAGERLGILGMSLMQDESMTNDWPPDRHSSSYRVAESIEGHELTYDVTVPGGRTLELETVRVGRHGGPNESDLAFRRDLYRVVGSIAVAGGQIEAAMKRLLLVLRGDDSVFALADHDWADLHERLRKEAAKPAERREELGEILDWAEANKLREHRHNAVHGA